MTGIVGADCVKDWFPGLEAWPTFYRLAASNLLQVFKPTVRLKKALFQDLTFTSLLRGSLLGTRLEAARKPSSTRPGKISKAAHTLRKVPWVVATCRTPVKAHTFKVAKWRSSNSASEASRIQMLATLMDPTTAKRAPGNTSSTLTTRASGLITAAVIN